VKKDGRPVPHARVEVEFYNREGKLRAPADDMITQTVKADGNGLFSYAAPIPGWWGFSALTRADHTLKHKGEDKEVELGAVIWVRFHPILSID
jgi:cobalt/nickel transport protein